MSLQVRDRSFESQRDRASSVNVGRRPHRDDGDAHDADDDVTAHATLPARPLKIALVENRAL
jgi:hypothetical protein